MQGRRDPMLAVFPRGAAVRLLLMALLAAGLGYLVLFWQPQLPFGGAPPGLPATPAPPLPQYDPALLAQVRDGTPGERLQVETAPLQHLLERALSAAAPPAPSGTPEQPLALAELRQRIATWRGRWLGWRGTIEELDGPKPGHPVRGC